MPKRSGCERSSAALQPAVQQVVLLFVASLLRSAEREAARLFEHSEFAQRRFPQKCFFFFDTEPVMQAVRCEEERLMLSDANV